MSYSFRGGPPDEDTVELYELNNDEKHEEYEWEDEKPEPKHDLAGFKTNDLMWYKESEVKSEKANVRVIACGFFFLLAITIIITASVWGIEQSRWAVDYDHDKVLVAPSSTLKCQFERNCTTACEGNIKLEHEEGCCTGCGNTGSNDCNFGLKVSWSAVEILPQRQRVWLLVSTNGEGFFQTGFGTYITNTSGTHIVGNACLSAPNQNIIVVACLSTYDMQDLNFNGFPADECVSTYGVCLATNNIFAEPLDACEGGLWEGNTFTTSWDGPKWNSSNNLKPLSGLIALFATLLLLLVQ